MKWNSKEKTAQCGDRRITKYFAWRPITVNATRYDKDTTNPKVTIWLEYFYLAEECLGYGTSRLEGGEQKAYWSVENSFLEEYLGTL